MPSSARYLTPHPPVLFSPPAKNLASGSTNSFSSSSSSSNFRSANYFERLSRASGASAYLTDLTPPITPSHSNLEVESKNGYFNRTLSESSGEKAKLCPLFRSTILSEEDAGYRADTDAIGTTASSTTGIPTLKRRGTGRRALKLMEDHTYPQSEASDSDDIDVDVPLLSQESSDDPVGTGDVEVDGEAEREYFDEENFSRDFERGMQLMYQEVMNGTSLVNYAVAEPEDQSFTAVDLLGDEPDIQIPSKPVLKATELDWDGSPLSLNDEPSFESISGSLISPIQPDSLPIMMSPAIYNEPPVHGSYPFSSPHMPISTLMFGTRGGERRSFPLVDLNGENLDIASLIRLEVATGNNVVRPTFQGHMGFLPPQSHPPPSPFSSYPSLQSLANATNHSPRYNPFTIPSPLFAQDSSLAQGQKQTPVESGGSVRVRDIPHSPMPVDRDQALVGLGLGALTEGCLRSSDSISKLDSLEPRSIVISDAKRYTADIALDTQQCSPCVHDNEECLKTEIESLCILSGSESLQFRASHTSIVNQDVQLDLPSYQVKLGENPGQVSTERDVSCYVENILDGTVESESGPSKVLSDPVPRTDDLSGLVTSGRRCSTESYKTLSSPYIDHEEGIQCAKPLIVQAPTFTSQDALPYPSDTVPITPDSTHLQSTSTLAENAQVALASSSEAHLAAWTDDVPRQSIEHSSLLFQDSPLRRLTLALESDDFLARLNQSQSSSLASSTPSHRQKTHPSRLGTSSPTVSPTDDPRSPCPEVMEYFHPESYIRGCLGVLPTAQSPSAGEKPLPSPSSSRPESFPLSLFSGLLWESNSSDGLGLGLPSNLVPGPPRQRDSAFQHDTKALSTTEECHTVAQLTDTLPSPSDGSASGTSPAVLFEAPTFVQRQLYVIPEQPSPLSTFSGNRSRSPSPGRPRQPSKSLWSAASILTRLRSSSRLAWRSVASKRRRDRSKTHEGDQPHDRGRSTSPFVDGHSLPLVEAVDDGLPTSKKSKKVFRRFLEKISARRLGSTPLSPLLQPEAETIRSPGIIEHPDAPRTFGILSRGPQGLLGSDSTSFRVLF